MCFSCCAEKGGGAIVPSGLNDIGSKTLEHMADLTSLIIYKLALVWGAKNIKGRLFLSALGPILGEFFGLL